MLPLETKGAGAAEVPLRNLVWAKLLATACREPRRADARRNRERVLAAAEAVFAECGLKAPVEEVARRAGVGVGTVCRNFPTKQALIEAVVGAMYETLLREVEAALADPDPAHAFERFVVGLPDFQARHRALADQMANENMLDGGCGTAREVAARGVRARRPGSGRGRDPRRHRARRRVDVVLRRRPRHRRGAAICSRSCASASCASSSTACAPTTPPRCPGVRSTSRSCDG